jgi:tetratricopeptide (TPR) repeat protein
MRTHAGDLNIDADRIGMWTCSANTGVGLPIMMQPERTYIKCGVVYYGSANLQSMRTDLPIMYVRSGLDGAQINTGIEHTIRHMVEVECDLTYIHYADGQHAFDILDDTDRSKQIIRQTLDFFTYNLNRPLQQIRPITAKRFSTLITQGDTASAFSEYRAFVKYIRQAGTYSPFYTWAINENGLVGTGYQLLQNKRTKEALAVFSMNAESFPGSPNAFDCLADAYEADGQTELAVINAQKALDLLVKAANLNENFKNGIRRSAEDKINRLKK